jgi:hypothetical protein
MRDGWVGTVERWRTLRNRSAGFHIALDCVPSGTQRRYADGPEADLKLRMLDARFSLMSEHHELDRSCPESPAMNGHTLAEMKASPTGAYYGLGPFLMDASQPPNAPYAILANQERRSCPEIWAAYS